jgi:uncharacterized membrane protein
MTASSVVPNRVAGRPFKTGGKRIPGWVFPLGAVIVVIAAFVWVAPIVAAYLGGDPIPSKVRNNADRAGWFVVHVLTGTTALFLGALQMYERLRSSYRNLHRWSGRLYVCMVLISAGTSLALQPRLSIYGTEYMRPLAAVLWAAFTILAVIAIRKSDIGGHRRWMTRSYAFTYMGLAFLILSAIGKNVGMPLEIRYPVVIWLSFLINVSAAEYVIWRSRHRSLPA